MNIKLTNFLEITKLLPVYDHNTTLNHLKHIITTPFNGKKNDTKVFLKPNLIKYDAGPMFAA